MRLEFSSLVCRYSDSYGGREDFFAEYRSRYIWGEKEREVLNKFI